MKYILFAVVVLAFSGFSHAASGIYSFKQVGVVRDGGKVYALLHVNGALSSVPDCALGHENQISIDIGDEVGKLHYSTALAAVMASQKVWISYSDSTCGVWGTRPLISRFDVRNY